MPYINGLFIPTMQDLRTRRSWCRICETEVTIWGDEWKSLCPSCKNKTAKRVVALHRERAADRAADELEAFYIFMMCIQIPIRARKCVAVFFQTTCWNSIDVSPPTLMKTIRSRRLPGRQIIMRTTRYEYKMYVGERAMVVGESLLWWKLDNGKSVPKNQCGKKWDWIESLDVKVLTFVSRRRRAIFEHSLEKVFARRAKEATCHAATIAHSAQLAARKVIDELATLHMLHLSNLGRVLLQEARQQGCWC